MNTKFTSAKTLNSKAVSTSAKAKQSSLITVKETPSKKHIYTVLCGTTWPSYNRNTVLTGVAQDSLP